MTDRDRLKELLKQAQDKYFELYFGYARVSEGKTIESFEDFCADHLLANGVVVPPCKVGDYVWLVFTPKYPANSNDYGKWFMKQDGVQRIIFGAKGLSIETWNMGTIPAKELGKKIFLTKEDAEKKLRELGNNG
jgi:hypothetical protein